MISMEEIKSEIALLENQTPTYAIMQNLASLYIVKDHMEKESITKMKDSAEILETDGDSEFLKAISGKTMKEVIPVMDDLMNSLLMENQKIYDDIMWKLGADR